MDINKFLITKAIYHLFPTMKYQIDFENESYKININNFFGLEVIKNETHIILGEEKISVFRFYDYLDLIIPDLSHIIHFYYHNGKSLVKIYSPHDSISSFINK